MKPRRLVLAAALALAAAGCPRRPDAPPGVRALREQRGRECIVLPVWDVDVAEEVATSPERYRDKTLAVQRAYLSPEHDVTVGERFATFPLRGGGVVVMPLEDVPAYLRTWTGAPLALRAVVHPPRPGDAPGPLLRGLELDTAHPLELAAVAIEQRKMSALLRAHVENLRDEAASATLELRFGTQHAKVPVGPVPPGQAVTVRLKLYKAPEPRWREFAREARRLRLVFEDGEAVSVDLGTWLEAPREPLLDWGYLFTPPANGALALSADEPTAELERFAALELRSYLARFTDANLQPVEPGGADPPAADLPLLVVGTARFNPAAATLLADKALAARLEPLGPEGYLLKTLRHEGRPTLLVTANTPRGLVHGVYGLLAHYGVRFTLAGARLPARGTFRLPDVDEARAPVFPRRRLVAAGHEPGETAQWSQWRWISLFDLAAKNRFNEVVMPLDGLEGTFATDPGLSRHAAFPFDVGPYVCLAEARVAHQHGLAVLAAYARRRGLDLTFARRDKQGLLRTAPPPACVAEAVQERKAGQPIPVLRDAGDRFWLPRVEEAAAVAQELVRRGEGVLSVPYRPGARARGTFLAAFAWDKGLTPKAYYRGWAATLCNGEATDRLAEAVLAVDKLDSQILAALPEPLGTGPPLLLPVMEGDLACDWAALRTRAATSEAKQQRQALQTQAKTLRELSRQLEPIHDSVRQALGSVPPPWEDPLFETASATNRAQRLSSGFYVFRGFLGGLARAHQGALAYLAALAEPEDALPRLRLAAGEFEAAGRLVGRVARRVEDTSYEPVLASLARQLSEQHRQLAEWLGPAAEASPVARLRVQGSDAIVHLFREKRTDIYAAYRLAGEEVVQLRLRTSRARVVRRGQPTRTLEAEGGVFLVSVDTVPTYLLVPRAAGPAQP